MLSAEKIQSNWNRYLTEVKNNISEERSSILLPFLKKYEERFMMMPASSKNWHHSAFAGGYCDHVLRVLDCANALYTVWNNKGGDMDTYTIEEMRFAALFHDLVKNYIKNYFLIAKRSLYFLFFLLLRIFSLTGDSSHCSVCLLFFIM